MKVILSKSGIKRNQWGSQIKPGVVYDRIKHGLSSSYIKIDGKSLYCSTDEDFLEVPEGCSVVRAKSATHQDTYSWNAGDYLVVKDTEITPVQYEVLYESWGYMMKADAELVTGPTQETSVKHVKVPMYIVLDQPVDGLTVGMHYEVDSINISGSYMVDRKDGYSVKIVSPAKCHPWINGEYKSVPCRCHVFTGFTTKPFPSALDTPMKLTNQQAPAPFKEQELTDDTRRAIKKQKELAKELLLFSMIMDHAAFLAGGAPRNWALNMEANDLDIFLRTPNGASESHLMRIIEAFGVHDVFNKTTHESKDVPRKRSYTERNNDDASLQDQKIHVVIEGKYQGQDVQFIFLRADAATGVTYLIRHFDTSINMIMSHVNSVGDLVATKTPSFTTTMETGVIFVYENGSAYGNPDHLQRIHSYFPEAPLVPEGDMNTIKRDPTKAWDYAMEVEEYRPETPDVDFF